MIIYYVGALLTRYQNIESSVNEARLLGKTGNQVFLTERCLDTGIITI